MPRKKKVKPDPKKAPAWLLPLAQERWAEVLPQVSALMAEIDREALAQYCQCYARYREAEDWMSKNGTTMTLRNDKGEVKSCAPVPHVGIAQKMLAEIHKYERAFGMTPAARNVPLDQMTDDELERIIRLDPSTSESGTGTAASA